MVVVVGCVCAGVRVGGISGERVREGETKCLA